MLCDSLKNIENKINALNTLCFNFSVVIAFLMPIPIVLDVILRLASPYSVFGVIEMEEIGMLFLVFWAMPALFNKDNHIRIELIDTLVSKKTIDCLEIFTSLISFAFFLFLSYCTYIAMGKKAGDVSLVFGLPLHWFIAITLVGIVLITVSLLFHCLISFLTVWNRKQYLWASAACAAACIFISSPIWIKAWKLVPSQFALGGIGMIVMLFLLLLRMPLGFAMGSVGCIGLLIALPKYQAVFSMIGSAPFGTIGSFTYAVVPLFILMGALCFRSGISNDLFNAAYTWLGRLPGGLAIASVAGCGGFAAVCGDSMATAVTMGTVALPEMRKKNYDPGLSCGSLAAGGTLGILIPPSIGFIFYAIITEESVGKLFAAGVVPGIILCTLFCIQVSITALRHPEKAPKGDKTSFIDKIRSLRGVIAMLLLFILILGGIFSGWFSPTEGGAVGAAGAFVFALFRGRVNKTMMKESLTETAVFSSKLMVILFGVGILGNFLAFTKMPYRLASAIIGWNMSPYLFFTALIVLFLILGCVMNVIPMLLLTLPSLYPTVVQLGFDPIWFGVVTVLVMEMGQITPPVGVNVFAISSVAKDVPLSTIFKGVLPFVITMLLMVFILVLFPGLATWLPKIIF